MSKPEQQELIGDGPCRFTVGHKTVMNKGKEEKAAIFCGKASQPGFTMCPKHILISQNEPEKRRLAALKGIARRQHRQALAEALATSPLRAYNPNYAGPKTKSKKKKAAYVDASV